MKSLAILFLSSATGVVVRSNPCQNNEDVFFPDPEGHKQNCVDSVSRDKSFFSRLSLVLRVCGGVSGGPHEVPWWASLESRSTNLRLEFWLQRWWSWVCRLACRLSQFFERVRRPTFTAKSLPPSMSILNSPGRFVDASFEWKKKSRKKNQKKNNVKKKRDLFLSYN